MKARIPHPYYRYIYRFSLPSILKSISYWSRSIFINPTNETKMFAGKKKYTIFLDNKKISGEVMLLQTWLIDLMFDVIKHNPNGAAEISADECLHLIALYNNFCNERDQRKYNKNNILLYLYAFFGEQKKFQCANYLFDDFAREKYILDIISLKKHQKNTFGIDIPKIFYDETGFKTDEYSAIMLFLFFYCTEINSVFKIEEISHCFKNPMFSLENIQKITYNNSITIEEIIQSPLKRQVFYAKPFIRIGNEYIASNPFLLLSAFVNSNFWVIRNKYLKQRKQDFTRAFGKYFEIYLEEILQNCLAPENYKNIPESSEGKRADWHLILEGYDILIEQKSSISLLSIKQNQPNIEAMKDHILEVWGEAAEQLKITEEVLGLNHAIKIILVYEDYFKSECLEELFKLNSSLKNDGRYWLVSIREIEMLLITYKNNRTLFSKILNEKIISEKSFSNQGRELSQFFERHDIRENNYINEFGIADYFDRIQRLFLD